jgi:lycopene cyclase domain
LAYLEIDLMIALPGLLSCLVPFLRRTRDFGSLGISIALTALLFIAWDELAVAWGTWAFNGQWVLSFRVGDLPIEEVLFFVVVPFSSLLFYDLLKGRLRGKFNISRRWIVLSAIVELILALVWRDHSYTWVVLVYLASGTLLSLWLDPNLLRLQSFWGFVGLTYIPFLVFDYLLTSIPIVIYGRGATLGIRVTTIPVEDFIYSMAMFIFYAMFYRAVHVRRIKR